ncbi:MAG: PP2C family serine/threonine-protein phosphatase [Ruminococcus sp.]|nr:PP2C family serine/threonine-protein phosphatase [Ruminococcus sp.]
MNYLTAVHTDIGIRKDTNQDSALVMEAETELGRVLLTVICDGMGGLAKGEVASSAVVNAFANWFEKEFPMVLTSGKISDAIHESWEQIVFSCNDKICDYGKKHGVSLGTTLVALMIIGDQYYIINIGDSRVYCITDGVYCLTKDQTFVQREMELGRMTYEQAMKSPQRSVLLQCIGASTFIDPEFLTGKCKPNQVFMLCSDGFRHVISEQEIFQSMNPGVLVNEKVMLQKEVFLVELNKQRMERDNITVALVKTV